ncbi:DEAD/DEAH box helicase, partial [Patescibacteria group bacterium]|nr:DEAD/DEAH box helicase [Patescibacteria group bacterium]
MDFNIPLENIIRLTPQKKSALKKLGLLSVRDLLLYAPARHEKFAGLKKISDLAIGENASIIGEVTRIEAQKTWRKKMNLAEAVIRDDTGSIKIIWFGQPYIANIIKPGVRIQCSGRVQYDKKNIYFSNPMWGAADNAFPGTGLLPIYSETYAISSQWLRYHIRKILEEINDWPDVIPEPILKKYHLPHLKQALWSLHFPKKPIEFEIAKKRFSFEEIFLIQLDRHLERHLQKETKANAIMPDLALMKRFVESLPFKLTGAQRRVIWQILEDVKKPTPMARLLEGDVGSGKTIVASAVALLAAKKKLQTAFMAPTEILARQHFQEFIKRLEPFRVSIGLLTSSESQKFPSKISYKKTADLSKAALLKQLASGEIQIIIGTHALIQNKVKFKSLGFVVIDEQHRFGTSQRKRLAKEKEEVVK